jgi:hypothetical protein
MNPKDENIYQQLQIIDGRSQNHRRTLVIVSAFGFQLLKSPTNAADCSKMQESMT